MGRYLVFEDPQPGAAITLAFPVPVQTATYTVNAQTPQEQRYTCEFRGSTLVEIGARDEAAASYPLYQRAHMRTSATPVRKVRRFLADRPVREW